MWHSLQFLVGFLLAYLILSPRLRGYTIQVIAGYILWMFPKLRKNLVKANPVEIMPVRTRKKRVESSGGTLEVDEDTLAEWQANLTRNGG